jgi:hypothetical protein
MSSHSIHIQSNSVLHDGPGASVERKGGAAVSIFDQGHRGPVRNCLHRCHHDWVAVMLADKPLRASALGS